MLVGGAPCMPRQLCCGVRRRSLTFFGANMRVSGCKQRTKKNQGQNMIFRLALAVSGR